MLKRIACHCQVEFLVTEIRPQFFLPMWRNPLFTRSTNGTKNKWDAVGRSKFYNLWSELLPHISISTPSSDLCFTCQQNLLVIQKSGCLSKEEKSEHPGASATCQNRAWLLQQSGPSSLKRKTNIEFKDSSQLCTANSCSIQFTANRPQVL